MGSRLSRPIDAWSTIAMPCLRPRSTTHSRQCRSTAGHPTAGRRTRGANGSSDGTAQCLDWIVPLHERHLRQVMTEWMTHYKRPHSAVDPGLPADSERRAAVTGHHLAHGCRVVSHRRLGGLHHHYALDRAACIVAEHRATSRTCTDTRRGGLPPAHPDRVLYDGPVAKNCRPGPFRTARSRLIDCRSRASLQSASVRNARPRASRVRRGWSSPPCCWPPAGCPCSDTLESRRAHVPLRHRRVAVLPHPSVHRLRAEVPPA